MTVNEKMKIFLDQIVESMARAIQVTNTEREVISVYLSTLNLLGTLCKTEIPDQSEDDELAFIKLNEEASDEIWRILKQNLKRVGSDLINDPRLDLLNPANGFRDGNRNSELRIKFVMPSPEIIQ
jgi:excinuclease UvrABC helicase subunit UvrB